MSNLTDHARRELELAGYFDKDGFYGDMLGEAVMKMVEQFSSEGHSGMSAGIAIAVFQKVASFEPLVPLTGEADEWVDHGEGMGARYQNNRCSHVFKDDDGNAYDSEGRIFKRPDGSCYMGSGSRVPVTFPYTPTREYVDVPD